MASSSSSSSLSWSYDVFLNFRGEDIRKTFVDHLYKDLYDRQIHTYKDDITLPRGDSVRPALLKAIDESKIAVIIFSRNYADSSWCLDELAHIMKRRADVGLLVLPVFYDVEPTQVRKQTGDFGRGFARLTPVENTNEAESWRQTLVDASNISGWELKNVADGHEAAAIKIIVDKIFHTFFSLECDDEKLVGMRGRVKSLISHLKIGSNGVRMVGIWGVGGGGKTTLASSVCKEISHHFRGQCFLENIREKASEYGLQKLQEDIISNVCKTEVKLQSVAEGKRKIKSMLRGRNVLVILDDVDKPDQLEALAGSHNWFGGGSRILITTRDEHLLRTHRVDYISPVTLLSQEEAIGLFNSHAYNEKKQVTEYEKLSSRVVFYAAGLPLALKVLGSFLYDKDEKEWMSTLDRLRDIPQSEILKQLKISYDGLETTEKKLFLDIACFFRRGGWRSREDAMEIFDACGFHPDIGIKVLIQKALITIDSDGEFDMHDLIQEMGHFIIRGEHPDNPEKHSRVWKEVEISNMCLKDTKRENNSIEAMQYSNGDHLSHFCKMVSSMKKLRWLSVTMYKLTKYHQDCEGPILLSNELRYMYWKRYPTSPFPESFEPMNLGVLKMENSFQKELWNSYKHLPKLKVLQLHKMKYLVSTPDLDGLPCLHKMEIKKCDMLEQIHPSLGNHRSLKYVKVSTCKKLRMFPTIVQMENLETLEISYCHFYLEFPEIQANLESLVKLYLHWIGIQKLLSSIGTRCTNIISLELVNCFISESSEVNFDGLKQLKDFEFNGFTAPKKIPPYILNADEPHQLLMSRTKLSILMLLSGFQQLTCSLRILSLNGCFLEDGEIPSCIGKISNLTELDLSGNDFSKLHFSLLQLHRLKFLKLSGCRKLVKLPKLPSRIALLKADSCDSLTTVGDLKTNCKWLCQVSLLGGRIIADSDRLLLSLLEGKAIENHSMLLRVQGIDIAKDFRPRLRDRTACTLLQLPENWCNDFCGFLMCVVLRRGSSESFDPRITMKQVTGGSMGMNSLDNVIWQESDDDITWLWYVSFGSLRHTSWWNPTCNNISFSGEERYGPLNRFGVRLVPRKSGTSTSAVDSSECSDDYDYAPKVVIQHDSTYDLQISPRAYRWHSDRLIERLNG